MKLFWIVLLVFLPSKGFAQWGLPGWPSLYIMLPNGQTPCTVDFEDFVAFAQAYGSTSDDQNYNFRADTNQDGIVNFSDFIAFAGQFGLSMPGTQDECLRALRAHIQVSGVVKQAEKPFVNVWGDGCAGDTRQFACASGGRVFFKECVGSKGRRAVGGRDRPKWCDSHSYSCVGWRIGFDGHLCGSCDRYRNG